MIQLSKNLSIFRVTILTLMLIGVGFMAHTSATLITQGRNAQALMKKSKTAKQAYGQSAQSRKESVARDDFDALYNKYIDGQKKTLKSLDKNVAASDLKKLNKLASQTGLYYKDEYEDRAKFVSLIADVQGDYLSLFRNKKPGREFKKSIRPIDVYAFNSRHYADLQTIMAIESSSSYPDWMMGEMQKMGADASKAEKFLKDFNKNFVFPTNNEPWQVKHSYLQADEQGLLEELNALDYSWDFVDYARNVIEISYVTASYNREMQNKVDEANRRINAVKEQVKRDQEKAKQDKKAADDAKKAAESNSKQSSSDVPKEGENASTSFSGGANDDVIPFFVGSDLSTVLKWASVNKKQVMQSSIKSDKTHGTILQQEWRNNALYVQVAQ